MAVQKDHETATQKILTMARENEESKATIGDQYRIIEDNKDEMEKIRLEVTVIMTEKTSIKKECARVTGLYYKQQRDFKDQRELYNQLVEELAKLKKQNRGYRELIVDSDQKSNLLQQEIRTL